MTINVDVQVIDSQFKAVLLGGVFKVCKPNKFASPPQELSLHNKACLADKEKPHICSSDMHMLENGQRQSACALAHNNAFSKLCVHYR